MALLQSLSKILIAGDLKTSWNVGVHLCVCFQKPDLTFSPSVQSLGALAAGNLGELLVVGVFNRGPLLISRWNLPGP